jgi:hypothetical protein
VLSAVVHARQHGRTLFTALSGQLSERGRGRSGAHALRYDIHMLLWVLLWKDGDAADDDHFYHGHRD